MLYTKNLSSLLLRADAKKKIPQKRKKEIIGLSKCRVLWYNIMSAVGEMKSNISNVADKLCNFKCYI